MEGDEDIIKEFLVECYESLDQLDRDLVALEDSPSDSDLVASIFRSVHSMKGTSGFLGLPILEKVSHVGENLLVPLRDGELSVDHEIADGLLGLVDAIRAIVTHLECDGTEGDDVYDDLRSFLTSLHERDPEPSKAAAHLPSDVATDGTPGSPPGDSVVANERPDCGVGHQNPASPEQPSDGENGDPVAEDLSAEKVATASEMGLASSTVRVNVTALDELMNLVGELVLARNHLLQCEHLTDDATFLAAAQQLTSVTSDLQERVMATRLQPIRSVWSKLPRVVRDLSIACGKQVNVQMEGADTELDKTVQELIKDPLTHIVRNSIDHGIELPEERLALGKPAAGTLSLRAFHEDGKINITICDDGRGINIDRIREKAIENGIISQTQASNMLDQELLNLVLLPGFSTARQVTNVSGRGVGMDVVKTNIEKIGGTLELSSISGEGTMLQIKIPLTLAIIPALLIESAGERYAIPQAGLSELVHLHNSRRENEIDFIHDVPVYRLRDQLIPLVFLNEQLGLAGNRDEATTIAVLQVEGRQFGLVVTAVTDSQEIVVKPLGTLLKSASMFSGGTIMADGTVALILDVVAIAASSHVFLQHKETAAHSVSNQTVSTFNRHQQSLLLFDPGDGSQLAVPLLDVARLEEFHVNDIETLNGVELCQYRGKVMPLVRLQNNAPANANQKFPTVVFETPEQTFGLIIGEIIDIVNHDTGTDQESTTSIINQRATTFLKTNEVAALAELAIERTTGDSPTERGCA